MADLKRVYAAPTEEIALAELDGFDEKWSGKYPKIMEGQLGESFNVFQVSGSGSLLNLYHKYHRGI